MGWKLDQLKATPKRQEMQYWGACCTHAVPRALQVSHRPVACRSKKGSIPCLWEAGSVHMAGMPTWTPPLVLKMLNQMQSAIIWAETTWMPCMHVAIKKTNKTPCALQLWNTANQNCLYTEYYDFRLFKWCHPCKGVEQTSRCWL